MAIVTRKVWPETGRCGQKRKWGQERKRWGQNLARNAKELATDFFRPQIWPQNGGQKWGQNLKHNEAKNCPSKLVLTVGLLKSQKTSLSLETSLKQICRIFSGRVSGHILLGFWSHFGGQPPERHGTCFTPSSAAAFASVQYAS